MHDQIHVQCLAPYTSWGIGGCGSITIPSSIPALQAIMRTEAPTFFMGLGSNILIPDEGLSERVILTHKGLSQIQALEPGSLYVEAGVPCAKIARFCVQRQWGPAAFLAGIPGTLGGALAMNAGAFGHEIWPYVTRLQIINAQGKLFWREPTDYEVAYRHQQLKESAHSADGPAEWFVAAHLCFQPGVAENIGALLKKRMLSQPIGQRSCGSVFKNPPGFFAAQCIESVGLKGMRMGDIQISEKHANFMINQGAAKAADVRALIAYVQKRVYEEKGIMLEPEVKILSYNK